MAYGCGFAEDDSILVPHAGIVDPRRDGWETVIALSEVRVPDEPEVYSVLSLIQSDSPLSKCLNCGYLFICRGLRGQQKSFSRHF